MTKQTRLLAAQALAKCPTGIRGLDQITDGGLPRGRSTLVCGGPGAGKTLLGIEFLARGARDFGEAGVFVSFEERADDLAKNAFSLGFDLGRLVRSKRFAVEHIALNRSELLEAGEYDLEGLFIRLGAAIDSVGAKRVVLDTIEALFGVLTNQGILRAELNRLFSWLKDKGVTTVITAERGQGVLTRHGLEEYVSDCVIVLDQRVDDQIATRRLRIVKYRGSTHGTNEYPFLIDRTGFVVLPITTVSLDYDSPSQFVSSGVAKLDEMLGGKGYFRASTIMVSGMAGTGKSSLAAHFVDGACRRGERCLYFAFEESPGQIMRNMRSIGIDLRKWVDRGMLGFHAMRPTSVGMETHISLMLKHIDDFQPRIVVLDPISSFEAAGTQLDAHAMLVRVIDLLKARTITTLFTSLTTGAESTEQVASSVSSLIDAWISLRNLEQAGERTRSLYVLKARGMHHSNQIREFLLTDRGADLQDVYVGPDGILVGSARAAQEMRDRAAAAVSRRDVEQKKGELERKHKTFAARIAELEAAYAAEAYDIKEAIVQEEGRLQGMLAGRSALATDRQRATKGGRR
ncbi:MAG TPA: circadian clock protein KaiC [Reyranella sp.]|nr:circadian clock protein KaiC [Reyranella sp.]